MTRFWFKPKRYGYGARPVTWEGWLLALAPAAVALIGTWWLTAHSSIGNVPLVSLLLVVLALTVAVALISRQKTDGPWRWRWGRWRS